jgi:hypothetical protein
MVTFPAWREPAGCSKRSGAIAWRSSRSRCSRSERSSSSSARPSAARGTRQKPLLRAADLGELAISIPVLAAYYFLFTLAWQKLRSREVRDTRLVLGSRVVEAGLSGLAGIIVFLVSLTTVGFSDAPGCGCSVWR